MGAAFVLLAALAGGGWTVYKRVRQKQMMTRARALIAAKDYAQAGMAIQRALQLNPRDVGAVRMMVEATESLGARDALVWRRILAEIEPGVLDNYLGWAKVALQFGQVPMAEQALANVDEAGRQTAGYHDMAGQLALALNDPAKAETEFAKALALEPNNEEFRFNLATAQLQSSDAEASRKAREEIRKLEETPNLHRRAFRVLMQDALRHKDWQTALALARDLQAAPDATFEDGALFLGLLRTLQRPEFRSYLLHLQERAAKNPDHIAALIAWMNRNTLTMVASEWGRTFPDEIRSQPPVAPALAESYANLRDWEKLRALVAEADWKDLDYMRMALHARVLREDGDLPASGSQWANAVKAALGRPEALGRLAAFATTARWETETNDLLWKVAQGASNQHWALAELWRRTGAARDTRGMLNVATRILELKPDDSTAQNNVASLSLLLGVNIERATALALAAHKKESANPGYAATYAYALHIQGKTQEALALMRTLPGKLLSNPSYAAYFGIFLAEQGEADEAVKFLVIASSARLLPEELELVAKARAKAEQARTKAGAPLP
jgi:predicted Zn-dependent protease